MSQYLINIVASSNFAAVISADTEATLANVAATDANTAAQLKNAAALSSTELRLKKTRKEAEKTATGLTGLLNRLRDVNNWLMRISGSQDTVGYNFMGLSLRIGKWIIPALVLLVSSMLPVITGLLAMGAAAGVAGLGLLSMVGLGAALMSHRFKQIGNPNGPEGFLQSDQTTIWTQLFKPIWAALDNPELKGATDNAVLFVQTLFGDTIPQALRNFLNNIDPGTMMVFEQLFQKWLPDMAGSLTRYGSQLFNIIGSDSLTRLNNFFKWMAGGIMGISIWLSSGGWKDMDGLTSILKDVISTLMDLGETALPFLVSALGKIWPNPLKPMLEAMTGFFEYLNNDQGAMDTMISLIQLVAIIWAVGFAIGLLAPVFEFLFSTAGLVMVGIMAVIAAAVLLGLVLRELVLRIAWYAAAVVTIFVDMMGSIVDYIRHVLYGDPYKSRARPDYYWDIATGKNSNARKELDEDWANLRGYGSSLYSVGEAGVNTIKLILEPKDGFVDVQADKQANQAFGTNVSWEVVNSQFRKGASI